MSFRGSGLILVALCVLATGGCKAGGAVTSSSFVPADLRVKQTAREPVKGIDKIQHIVIIIQENRSLNNSILWFPGRKDGERRPDLDRQKGRDPAGLARYELGSAT